MRMDTHLVGSLHQLHRRLDELMGLIRGLQEEVKEIRQSGVAINFQLGDDEEEEESEEESGEESEGSGESANTWP